MRMPSFSDYLDRDDTQEYIRELEDAYDTLDKYSSLRIFDKQEFIQEILEADYESEIGAYFDRCYDEWKEKDI